MGKMSENRLRATEFYDRFHKKSYIQSNVVTENSFTYKTVISVIKVLIEDKKLQILDFGCGVGTIDFYMASKGNNVVGIDISNKAIQIAKENSKLFGLENRTDFFTSIEKLEAKKFDLIICIEVLEHISDDRKTLNLLAKYLKNDGILILSSPSGNAPLYKLGLARKFDKEVGHLRRYTVNDLQNKITEAGFEVIKTVKTEGIIRNSLYVIPFLGRLVRFIRGPLVEIATYLDNLTIPIFGESDIFIIAKKK